MRAGNAVVLGSDSANVHPKGHVDRDVRKVWRINARIALGYAGDTTLGTCIAQRLQRELDATAHLSEATLRATETIARIACVELYGAAKDKSVHILLVGYRAENEPPIVLKMETKRNHTVLEPPQDLPIYFEGVNAPMVSLFRRIAEQGPSIEQAKAAVCLGIMEVSHYYDSVCGPVQMAVLANGTVEVLDESEVARIAKSVASVKWLSILPSNSEEPDPSTSPSHADGDT